MFGCVLKNIPDLQWFLLVHPVSLQLEQYPAVKVSMAELASFPGFPHFHFLITCSKTILQVIKNWGWEGLETRLWQNRDRGEPFFFTLAVTITSMVVLRLPRPLQEMMPLTQILYDKISTFNKHVCTHVRTHTHTHTHTHKMCLQCWHPIQSHKQHLWIYGNSSLV